jgi:hypothetical protein
MQLALTVLAVVLALTAVVGVAGYLIDRGVRRHEENAEGKR